MLLYATKAIAAASFTDDASFVAAQKLSLEKRGTFRLVSPATVRIQAVAVDADGVIVTAAGTFNVVVIEVVERKEVGDNPTDNAVNAPYLVLADVAATGVVVGTSEPLALQPGTYALQFDTAALLPAAANLRIYMSKG